MLSGKLFQSMIVYTREFEETLLKYVILVAIVDEDGGI